MLCQTSEQVFHSGEGRGRMVVGIEGTIRIGLTFETDRRYIWALAKLAQARLDQIPTENPVFGGLSEEKLRSVVAQILLLTSV